MVVEQCDLSAMVAARLYEQCDLSAMVAARLYEVQHSSGMLGCTQLLVDDGVQEETAAAGAAKVRCRISPQSTQRLHIVVYRSIFKNPAPVSTSLLLLSGVSGVSSGSAWSS